MSWIKIEGLPISAWDCQSFESIGGLFGKVVSPVSSPLKCMDLFVRCMGVLVKSIERIEEMVEVIWHEKHYKIFVCEDMWPRIPAFVDAFPESSHEDKKISTMMQEILQNILTKEFWKIGNFNLETTF